LRVSHDRCYFLLLTTGAPPRQLRRWVPSDMDETELDEVVTSWIEGQEAERGSPAHERCWWAISEVMDWSLERKGEQLWRFILAMNKRDISPEVAAVFAAGPIEDLLGEQGSEFIDRVEELARKDPKFNHVLGGVWRNTMSDDIWQRVQSARHLVW
jgi:hypothetical protein